MLHESGEEDDYTYKIKVLVPLHRAWLRTKPVKPLAIIPPIPPSTVASCCIVPLAYHLMKQETPKTIWAKEIDQEFIAEE